MNFIGIDPGKSGGMAVIHSDGHVYVSPYSMQRYKELISHCPAYGTRAVVEDVHAMPGQGVTSMFSFGENKGFIEGLLFSRDIPFELVSPMKWKKSLSLIFPKGTDKKVIKERSCIKAAQLFPNVSLYATPRCTKPHDGIAEALLIAYYCRRNFELAH